VSKPKSGFPQLPARAAPATKLRAIVAVIQATGLHPRQAALSVGVSASAFYRLVDDHPHAREAIEGATAVHARHMAAVVATAAVKLGSWRAAAWWLERRLSDVYGEKAQLAIEFDTPTLEDRLAAEKTPEELDAQLEALAEEVLRRRRAREGPA
jgi:hypothetical protein